MAIHVMHLRFRQAPLRRGVHEVRPPRTFSFTPMDRLNAATSDARLRLHATGIFIVGMAALAAIFAIV